MAIDTALRFTHAETYSFNVIVMANGVAVNLTGASVFFTAKWKYNDTDADAVFQLSSPSGGIVLTNPASGALTVTIPSSATLTLPYYQIRLVYDLLVVELSGERHIPLRGMLVISPNVSRG